MAKTWMLFCTTLHYCWRQRKRTLLGKGSSFQSRKHCRWTRLVLCIMKKYFLHVNHIFSYTFCHFCCCCSLFSYLIAVFSKLFLPQPMIFTVCASSSLHPAVVGMGRAKRESEREQCGWESLTGGTEVGSTIPKSQVMFVMRFGGMQTPFPLHGGMCALVLWYTDSTLFGQPQGCVQLSDGSDHSSHMTISSDLMNATSDKLHCIFHFLNYY